MKRSARFAWLGLLALALAVVYSQTTITPAARAQSSSPAVGDLGTLADFQALVQPLGFTGADSPLPDGTPRWVATSATDGATAEAIGPQDALSQVTYAVTIPTAADSSSQLSNLVMFLTKYSLASEFYVIAAIGTAANQDQDQTQTFDNRSVHVTAAQAPGGTDLKIEILPVAGGSGEPTFELPSFAIPSFEIPSFAIPSFEIPSFAPDADLVAKFPATIDGQPVTNVQTFLFIDVLRFEGETDQQIQALTQVFSQFGMDVTTLSAGTADATVDGSDVRLSAFRAPGANADEIVANYNELAAALDVALGQPAPSAAPTMTQTNLGGKNVTISTDADGTVTYLYASGDTLWSLSDVTEDQVAKVFSALQ